MKIHPVFFFGPILMVLLMGVLLWCWFTDEPTVSIKEVIRIEERPYYRRMEINDEIQRQIGRGNIDVILQHWSTVCSDVYMAHIIMTTALIYDIPVCLLFALFDVESSFDPLAEGVTGDLGIAQLNPQTFEDYTKEQLLLPPTNIRLGAEHLCQLRSQNGSWEKAIYRYNGRGDDAVDHLIKVIQKERSIEQLFNGDIRWVKSQQQLNVSDICNQISVITRAVKL